MVEICVALLESADETIKKLENQGFTFVESYKNYDTYFTTINKLDLKTIPYKTLLDNSVLIRHCVCNDHDEKSIIYKSKTLDASGNVIQEIKSKVIINNIEKAKEIFNNLNLKCWCDYTVENIIYKKENIEINIQRTNALGDFIEIEEFPEIKDKPNVQKFDILKNLISSMDIKIGNDYSCKKPYMMLNQNTK